MSHRNLYTDPVYIIPPFKTFWLFKMLINFYEVSISTQINKWEKDLRATYYHKFPFVNREFYEIK